MNRTKVNYGVDSLSMLLFLALALTGMLLAFGLPGGIGRDAQLWGLSRHDWGEVHFWIAVSFLLAIAVHFVLHWTWIRATSFSKLIDRRLVAALLVTLGVMVIVFVAAMWSAPSGDLRAEGEFRHERRGAGAMRH